MHITNIMIQYFRNVCWNTGAQLIYTSGTATKEKSDGRTSIRTKGCKECIVKLALRKTTRHS